MDKAKFDAALESFRSRAETVAREHFDRNGYTFAVPGVRITSNGRRFAKLISFETRNGESMEKGVHSFVEIETGDIFKPKTYKAPAKHSRGNIFTDDHGLSSLTDTGSVKYLR